METGSLDPHRGALGWVAGWNSLLGSQGCFLEHIESIGDLTTVRRRGPRPLLPGTDPGRAAPPRRP